MFVPTAWGTATVSPTPLTRESTSVPTVYWTISFSISACPVVAVIPANFENGAVLPIETEVLSAVIASVIGTNNVSGLTSLISTLLFAPWCAWLICNTSRTLPENNSPFWTESPLTATLDITALVSLLVPYSTSASLLGNLSPWTSVRNKVSNVVEIFLTTNFNPAPLMTWAFELSTVKTSPTW